MTGLQGQLQILEDELVEEALFDEFIGQFMDTNPEYNSFSPPSQIPQNCFDLIKELAAKGVFPTARAGIATADRILTAISRRSRTCLRRLTNHGTVGANNHAFVRSSISTVRTRLATLRGSRTVGSRDGGKRVPDTVARRVFEEDKRNSRRSFTTCITPTLSFALRPISELGFLPAVRICSIVRRPRTPGGAGLQICDGRRFQDPVRSVQADATAGGDEQYLCGRRLETEYLQFQYADVDNIGSSRRDLSGSLRS